MTPLSGVPRNTSYRSHDVTGGGSWPWGAMKVQSSFRIPWQETGRMLLLGVDRSADSSAWSLL